MPPKRSHKDAGTHFWCACYPNSDAVRMRSTGVTVTFSMGRC
jgi:hypothetical protein